MEWPSEENQPTISLNAGFNSFAEFESVFELWKLENMHPFRIANSETLLDDDEQPNSVFKYKHVVYHCIHYGYPRNRDCEKRSDDSFLPSGCKAMLRLDFNSHEKLLRITKLCTEHKNHRMSTDYCKGKVRILRSLSESNWRRDIDSESPTEFSKPFFTTSGNITPPSSPNHVPFSSSFSSLEGAYQPQVTNDCPDDFAVNVHENSLDQHILLKFAKYFVNNAFLNSPCMQMLKGPVPFTETSQSHFDQINNDGSNDDLSEEMVGSRNEGINILNSVFATMLSGNHATVQRLIPILRNLRDLVHEG